MMKVVRMMVIIPHVMVEEPHKMAKALHILTEAPLEKTFHHFKTVLAFHNFSLRSGYIISALISTRHNFGF
jgi:hypothetical protein